MKDERQFAKSTTDEAHAHADAGLAEQSHAERRCDKMAALGTLTAGLMHELHNPAAAAQRAGARLRENLLRLQQLSLRFSQESKSPEQLECMRQLLDTALNRKAPPALSSVAQAEAEDALTEWLEASGVENAPLIASALVSMGIDHEALSCAQHTFRASQFSDSLNWLEALVTSASLVNIVEESLTRIASLTRNVKEYAHEDASPQHPIDLHKSLQSALNLLEHKLRLKQITVVKCFSADPATLGEHGDQLSQVWLNLIDNAIDASNQEGCIEIATGNASETEPPAILVSITDHGSGISPETLPHIFTAFYTTKPQGQGTGLGLEIAQRIVTEQLKGSIEVESVAGRTQFLVRVPRHTA